MISVSQLGGVASVSVTFPRLGLAKSSEKLGLRGERGLRRLLRLRRHL